MSSQRAKVYSALKATSSCHVVEYLRALWINLCWRGSAENTFKAKGSQWGHVSSSCSEEKSPVVPNPDPKQYWNNRPFFRVSPRLCFKTRFGAQPSSWKWVLFAWEWKMISISQAEHLTSFWNRGLGELGNGLLKEWHVIVFCDQLGETLRAALTELKEVSLIGVLNSLKGLVSTLFENKKNGVNRPNLLKGNLTCGKFSFLGATRFVSYNMDLQFSRKHLSGNKLYRVMF